MYGAAHDSIAEKQKKTGNIILSLFTRADEQIRTADLLITNEVRYQLCHVSVSFAVSPISQRQQKILYTIKWFLSTKI